MKKTVKDFLEEVYKADYSSIESKLASMVNANIITSEDAEQFLSDKGIQSSSVLDISQSNYFAAPVKPKPKPKPQPVAYSNPCSPVSSHHVAPC